MAGARTVSRAGPQAMGSISAAALRFVDEVARTLKPLAARRRPRRRLVLVDRGGTYECFRIAGQAAQPVASGTLEDLAGKLGSAPVELRLGSEQVVWNRLSLPRSSRDVLEPVLRHQLERLTPWASDRVAFDYAVSDAPDDGSGQISVSVVTTSRDILDAALNRLERLGIRPIAIGTADDPIEKPAVFDLLSDGDTEALKSLRRKVIACLAAILIVGGGIGAYTGWQLSGIQAEARALGTALAERQSLIDAAVERAAAAREGHRLAAGKRDSAPMIVVLDELSTVLPDDTYLTELAVEPSSQVRLSGFSSEASELIALLESSELLTEVEFSAPITRSGDAGRDSFQIVARLRAQGE